MGCGWWGEVKRSYQDPSGLLPQAGGQGGVPGTGPDWGGGQ